MPTNCSLLLEAFDDDKVTVLWEVSTDPDHARPYLSEPEHYGEQEIDIVQGGATISQVEVLVIDRPQIIGDQSSGWMTERIVEDGIGAIFGRRFRLSRFINDLTGYVVIADGPAGTPRLDESYAAYRWIIRDTRETERKLVAFTQSSRFGLFPAGLYEDQGWGQLPDASYLVPAIAAPAEANVAYNGEGTRVTFNMLTPGAQLLTQATKDIASFLITNGEFTQPPGANQGFVGEYENLILRWRFSGETDDDWREIVAPAYFGNINSLAPYLPVFFRTGVGDVTAEVGDPIDRIVFSFRPEEEEPPESSSVEFVVFYQGPISEQFPKLVDGITAGQFIKNMYDGVYSPVDVLTGAVIPSGIRYDEAQLLLMTDPVQLRLTERIDDARDWIESRGYAPTGWCPALDNDLQISPVSQVPPENFTGVSTVDDVWTKPTPDWDAGERIINILRFTYPRWYAPDDVTLSEGVDGLLSRTIIIEFRDEAGILRYGENTVEYEGELFAALGNNIGDPALVAQDELGRSLANDRKLYVFDRFVNGAQLINVPIMRAFSSDFRAGSFIIVDLSWIPDYILRRRGGAFGGQVLSIRDTDCAWRVMVIEEILPLTLS